MQRHLTNISGSYSSNLDREVLRFFVNFCYPFSNKNLRISTQFPLLILKFNDNGPSKKKKFVRNSAIIVNTFCFTLHKITADSLNNHS